MVELVDYAPSLLAGMVEAWNAAFVGGPNFVEVTEDDLLAQVTGQPSFDLTRLLVAVQSGSVVGFAHFGHRTNLWYDVQERRPDWGEGQVYSIVAPESDRPLMRLLLAAAVEHFREQRAKRILLGPNWVYGTQPFYNCIAGAYEIPGLSTTRTQLLEVAAEQGFSPVAECATPELDLGRRDHIEALQRQGRELLARARSWGVERDSVALSPRFFHPRQAVVLRHGSQTVAMTAYGLWHEYLRQYGRRLFGISSVQVVEPWRGRGLGKLLVILAMEAALALGAEGLHLHVWRGNEIAWRLYHEAIGFQPNYSWVTLEKRLD